MVNCRNIYRNLMSGLGEKTCCKEKWRTENESQDVIKILTRQAPEFLSSQECTKQTATYRTIPSEKSRNQLSDSFTTLMPFPFLLNAELQTKTSISQSFTGSSLIAYFASCCLVPTSTQPTSMNEGKKERRLKERKKEMKDKTLQKLKHKY